MSNIKTRRTTAGRVTDRPAPTPNPRAEAPIDAEQPERHAATSVTPEAISHRAYEKFLERGCVHGHDHEDWCAAEAELLTEIERQQR